MRPFSIAVQCGSVEECLQQEHTTFLATALSVPLAMLHSVLHDVCSFALVPRRVRLGGASVERSDQRVRIGGASVERSEQRQQRRHAGRARCVCRVLAAVRAAAAACAAGGHERGAWPSPSCTTARCEWQSERGGGRRG
jgi:hypothetical protein